MTARQSQAAGRDTIDLNLDINFARRFNAQARALQSSEPSYCFAALVSRFGYGF